MTAPAPEPVEAEKPGQQPCPHCEDGHQDPRRVPWCTYVEPEEVIEPESQLVRLTAVAEAARALTAARTESWFYRGLDDTGERALSALGAALEALDGGDRG